MILGSHSILFMIGSKKTPAKAAQINGSNTQCKGGGKLYDCTKFYAWLEYKNGKGDISRYQLPIGSAKGLNVPVTQAKYPVGSTIVVMTNDNFPSEVHEEDYTTNFFLIVFPILLIVLYIMMPGFYGKDPVKKTKPAEPTVTQT